MKPTRQRKAFAFELKSSADDGTFVGVASTYGNKDLGGDIVDKGAFTKTLSERGATVPILWQHDPTIVLGKGVLTDTPQGLQIAGKLTLAVEKALECHALMKDDVINGLSIGYEVVKQKHADGARHLQELKLFEVSVVTFPMNEDAQVASVKAFDAATIDVKALQLPVAIEAGVMALLVKSGSYSARMQEAYEAIRAAFPLVYAYVDEVSEDQIIVCSDGDFFAVQVTGWNDQDEPTLGTVTPGEWVFVPRGAAMQVLAGDDAKAVHAKAIEAKASRRQTAIQDAHDALVKAGAACSETKTAATTSTPDPGAAPASAEPDLIHSLSALNDNLRRLTAAK